ncbi:MAG: hypothetical protein ACP5JF_08320 [Candidatus Methanodesulfokora sp.]|jgi:UDP-N-acetyl-D-mannosaminuronate dehydrogenase
MGKQRIHLDTSVLICCIHAKAANKLGRNSDKDKVEYGNKLIAKLKNEKKNPEVEIVVSSEALGETVNKLKNIHEENDFLECIKALFDILNELSIEYCPPRIDVDEIAIEIAKRDKLLGSEFSDCQIVAYALADRDSTELITLEGKIIKSVKLKELIEDMKKDGRRERGLRITSRES